MDFRRRMSPIPLSSIRLTDRFWSARQAALIDKGLEAQFQQIVSTGRLESFRRVARGESGTHEGKIFNDSDVYKWLEACGYALAIRPNDRLKAHAVECVEAICGAQEPDGYLNTFFQLNHPGLKWRNLGSMHEMYCGGHLIEGAIALHQATGDRRLLDCSIRFADRVASIFGPGKRKGYCGHEEFELALVKLADHTGEERFRDLARWMVMERGSRPSPFEQELKDAEAMKLSVWAHEMFSKDGVYTGEYMQDHAPVEEHTDVVGHAVRAMYLYTGAAEFAPENPKIGEAMARAWANLTGRRMYVTGGIGPSGDNEGFTIDYDLPNRSAYAETCAAIGLVLWGRRMLQITGQSEYADTVERSLYNGSLSGISLDGSLYFYTNPLESRGEHKRVPWFGCACCPPNVAREVLSVSDHLVSISAQGEPDALWLHIPASLEADFVFGDNRGALKVEGNYPWDGAFRVSVKLDGPADFKLHIRIPGWCEDCRVRQSDGSTPSEFEDGYVAVRRTWKDGDWVEVELDMAPKWVASDPRVLDNLGRAALCRGPLVYCLEEADFGAPPQYFRVDVAAEPISTFDEGLLGGLGVLEVEGEKLLPEVEGDLYRDLAEGKWAPSKAQFIPYYAWCNRGPNGMVVWVPVV